MALLTTEAAAEQLFHVAHTQRMLARLPSAPVDETHAAGVVALALTTLRAGSLPDPHGHPLDEATGGCVHCDAMALRVMIDIELLQGAA